MSPSPSELAVLFADVSGSTRLYEELGDAEALSTIGRCLAVVKAACEGHSGRVVKTIGDEAMAVFPAADHAAEAAAEIQARVSETFAGSQRLALRVGFHYGPALESERDVFGDSVNLAARLVGVANRAQVITSAETAANLSPHLRARMRELDALTVRGKLRDIRIFELLWQDSPDELTTLATRNVAGPAASLQLRHGERVILLGEDDRPVAFGRDAQNDVVIADRMASRMHARIERRSAKFVLVDHSSNGTYVTVEGEAPVQVKREEVTLRGRGRIGFGHAARGETDEFVAFACNA
jgi:adenylate cyclase